MHDVFIARLYPASPKGAGFTRWLGKGLDPNVYNLKDYSSEDVDKLYEIVIFDGELTIERDVYYVGFPLTVQSFGSYEDAVAFLLNLLKTRTALPKKLESMIDGFFEQDDCVFEQLYD